jgi:hypothetical protein
MISLPYSFTDLYLAIKIAELRQFEAQAMGCKDRMPLASIFDALEIHTIGALAELKVSHWLGSNQAMTHATFKDDADIGKDIEVRAIRKREGRLVYRDNDAPDRRYILTYVSRSNVELLGWLEGYNAIEMGIRDNPRDGKPAWFVTQDKLWSMETFEKEIYD